MCFMDLFVMHGYFMSLSHLFPVKNQQSKYFLHIFVVDINLMRTVLKISITEKTERPRYRLIVPPRLDRRVLSSQAKAS